MPIPATRSTSSRSFPLSPYSRRWRIPRHTAVNGCWTASPSICIHACPVLYTGGHAGPPLQHVNTPRKHTTHQCRSRPMCLPCAHDAIHQMRVYRSTSAGRTVKPSHNDNRCVARSDTCGTHHHKTDDPEGGRTVAMPIPATRSTSSRSFPLSPHSRRWRIPRHTAVNGCWTASPSICIRVCPVPHIGRTRRSAPTTHQHTPETYHISM